jgi:hypothetical protein
MLRTVILVRCASSSIVSSSLATVSGEATRPIVT